MSALNADDVRRIVALIRDSMPNPAEAYAREAAAA